VHPITGIKKGGILNGVHLIIPHRVKNCRAILDRFSKGAFTPNEIAGSDPGLPLHFCVYTYENLIRVKNCRAILDRFSKADQTRIQD
jgi:hypothetical protein